VRSSSRLRPRMKESTRLSSPRGRLRFTEVTLLGIHKPVHGKISGLPGFDVLDLWRCWSSRSARPDAHWCCIDANEGRGPDRREPCSRGRIGDRKIAHKHLIKIDRDLASDLEWRRAAHET